MSDRENYQAYIGSDAPRVFYQHLENNYEKIPKLDVFVYSIGGDASAPWRIVSLFREFAEEINILVPYRALSAATIIAIGMDSIVMGKKRELGPIDPTVDSEFNPIHPITKDETLRINVEDVSSYIDLMKKFGITGQEQIGNSFTKLADAVDPIALGYINRHYSFIRMVSTKLLKSQNKPFTDQKIQHVVKELIEEIYFHGHGIARSEAKDIGLKIIYPDNELEELMWKLYLEYEKDLNLIEPINAKDILDEQKTDQFVMKDIPGGYIESERYSHVFKANINLVAKRIVQSANININFQLPQNKNELDFDRQQLQKLDEHIKIIVLDEVNKQSYISEYRIQHSKLRWSKQNWPL